MVKEATALGYPDKTGFAFHWENGWNQRHPKRFVHETGLKQYCPDRYPFDSSVAYTDVAAVQTALNHHISSNLLQEASEIRDLGTHTPIWFTPQAHADLFNGSPSDIYRLPTVREILVQVMMSLCYGVKGVW
jgi:hypothetical protein